MEVDYAQILSDHYDTLLRAIDPTTNLINRLRISNVISKDDAEKIKTEPSTGEKIESLLMLLMDAAATDRNAVCFRALFKALRESGQQHVASLFDPGAEHSPDNMPMSEEHWQVLDGKLDKISEVLDPECGIAEALYSARIFTMIDREKISLCSTYDAKAEEVVKILMRKPDRAYWSFLDALRKTGQEHVVHILAGDDKTGKPPVREEFLCNMRKQRISIVECMEPKHSGLLDMLVSGEVIHSRDYDRIDPSPSPGLPPATDTDMNLALLRLLPRRPQESFDKFIISLVATQQSKVAQLFVGEEVNGKMKIMFKCGVDGVQKGIANGFMVLELAKLVGDGIQLKNDLVRVLAANDLTISYVKEGCIAIGFRCNTVEVLQNLRELHENKELDRLFTELYSPGLAEYGGVSLTLEIPEEEFARCKTNFEQNELMTPVHRQALLLAAKSPTVLEQVTVNDELMCHLSLCERRKRAIKSSTGTRKAATLFEIISRQPDWAFDKLVYGLRQTHQSKVVDFVINPSMIKSHDPEQTVHDNQNQRDNRKSESEQLQTGDKDDSKETCQTTSKTEPSLSSGSSRDVQHQHDLIKRQQKQISDLEFKQKRLTVKLEQAAEEKQLLRQRDAERKVIKEQLKAEMKRVKELTGQLNQAYTNAQAQMVERNSWQNASQVIVDGVVQQLQGVLEPVVDYQQQIRRLGAMRQPAAAAGYNLKETGQRLGNNVAPSFPEKLPTELLELILIKIFIQLFKAVPLYGSVGSISIGGLPVMNWGMGIMTEQDRHRMASITCYMSLAAVCNQWRKTMNGGPNSRTRCWFKRKLRRALKGHIDRAIVGKLNFVRSALIQLMEPDYGLLEELVVVGFLTRLDYAGLQNEPTGTLQRNAAIVQNLYASFTEERCRKFLHALRQANQQHLVNYIMCRGGQEIIAEYGDVRPLSDAHMAILDVNIRQLVEYMDPSNSLISRLFNTGCINVQQRSALSSDRDNTHQRNRKLVGILSRRSVADFNNFIQCLVDENQTDIAQLLRDAAEKKRGRDSSMSPR